MAEAIDIHTHFVPGSIPQQAGRGPLWPSIERSPNGFYVVWQDDRDKEGDDIFLRHLSSDLEVQGNEARLTDYLSSEVGDTLL